MKITINGAKQEEIVDSFHNCSCIRVHSCIQSDDRRNLICIMPDVKPKTFSLYASLPESRWNGNSDLRSTKPFDYLITTFEQGCSVIGWDISIKLEFHFYWLSDKLACKSSLICNEDVLSFSIFVFSEKRIHPLKAKCRLVGNRYDCARTRRLFKTCQGSTWLKILRC